MKPIVSLIRQVVFLLAMVLLISLITSMTCHGATQAGMERSDTLSKTHVGRQKSDGGSEDNSKEPKIVFRDGKLAVRVIDEPLRSVMKEITRVTGVPVELQSEEITALLSVQFTDRPLEEALHNILEGESYLLLYSSSNGIDYPSKIIVLPSDEIDSDYETYSQRDRGRSASFSPPLSPSDFAQGGTIDMSTQEMFDELPVFYPPL